MFNSGKHKDRFFSMCVTERGEEVCQAGLTTISAPVWLNLFLNQSSSAASVTKPHTERPLKSDKPPRNSSF